MPKRKYELTEEESDSKRAASRLKRSRAGKAAWARKSPAEKEAVIERLAKARGTSKVAIRKKGIYDSEAELRRFLYENLQGKGFTKREAQRLISFVKQDTGLQKRKTKPYKSAQQTAIPPLYNPLPKFFADTFQFFKRRTQQHFGALFDMLGPVTAALGIVPANTPLFPFLINEILK